MAQMQQKLINNQIQATTSHEEFKIPSYYKANAVNPALFAEQQRKRKLLWSKPKDSNEIVSRLQIRFDLLIYNELFTSL